MRLLLFILFIFFKASLFGQDNTTYFDTSNHFIIGIPKGWMVEQKLNDNPTALTVRLNKLDKGGIIPSYIVNIIQYKNTTLEKFYKNYCRPFDSPNEDHILIAEGDYFANGINYKWILTKSKSLKLNRSLIYYCYKDGNIYQISFSADLRGFSRYQQTFKNVIDTFKI